MKLVILVNLMMSYYWAVVVLTQQLSMPVKFQNILYNQVTVIYLQQVTVAQLTSLKTLVILLKHQHFLLLGLALIDFQQLCLVAKLDLLTHYSLNFTAG